MNKQNSFDISVCSRIMRKLEIRAMLFATLSVTIGVGLLFNSNSNFIAEISFFTFSLIAFSVLGIAMVYKVRHQAGTFGTRPGDVKLILAWTQEENHWWGKAIF